MTTTSTASMNDTPNIHAIIVAAGFGTRYDDVVAKQYAMVKGKTVLEHSVACLSKSRHIDQCLIVIAEEDTLAPNLNYSMPVQFTTGGAERWQSVQAGINALLEAGAQPDDLVVIHDAARLCVPTSDVNKVIDAAILQPHGAILAHRVANTLKKERTDAPMTIEKTISRERLWQALTPQVFRLQQVQKALEHVATHNLDITDEASAFEALNLPFELVEGSQLNIKLTYPGDMPLIAAIITMQSRFF